MPIDYGSNNVITSGNISSSGIVTATSGVFNGRLDINNDIKANGFRTIQLDRTVAGALNSYTDIGSIDMTNGAHNLSISIAASIGGYSVAKTYLLSGQYNSDPSWVIVAPLSDSGPYESQNFELLAQFSGSSCNLRIRKSSGSSGGGAYNVTILYTGYSSITWTPSTATGTDSTVYSVCNSALISQADGKVGIGTTSPIANLHVVGSGFFSGGLNIDNQTASTIAGFDASKNVTSLSTATYPSLTELSYVKGVTSAIQTQLNGKSATSHTHTSSDITNFNVAVSGLLGKTIAFFTPMDNMPPASNFATLDTRNSIIVLDFDGGSTNEEAVFTSVIPHSTVTTSGLLVRINWMATSATTGNCRWGVQFEKMTTDLDADSFDTATEAHSATNATAGIPTITELTCTSIDSLVAGDFYRMKVYRDASDTTNDTIATDTELISVEVRSIA